MSSGNVMFSRAVSVGSRLNDWKMNPTRLRRSRVSSRSLSPLSGVWPMYTRPEVGLSNPARQCIRVDLPDPEGPMIAVSRPGSTATLTWSKATTRVSPSP
jgi:hypothetical protein